MISWLTLGVAGFSQVPEFSQQYKQRLGGGITELATVVSQFGADAASEGLTREEALSALKNSGEEFPQTRGISMEKAILRYENLLAQRSAMENAGPFMQPVHLFKSPDSQIFSGTLSAFKPGIQLTLEGLFWGLVGVGFLGGGCGLLPVAAIRYRAKRKREPRVTLDPLVSSEGGSVGIDESRPGRL